MTLDTKMRATAQKLLLKFGKTCVFKSVNAGAYDPATGSSATTFTAYSLKLYLDQPNKTDLQGGMVTTNDQVAIFAATGLPVAPDLNDLITIDGRDQVVKMVSRVWSGDQVALWRVGLAS